MSDNQFTDSKGRTVADRLAKLNRATPPRQGELDRTELLLVDMLAAADRHGVTLDDFDWVADLPTACFDVIRTQMRNGR